MTETLEITTKHCRVERDDQMSKPIPQNKSKMPTHDNRLSVSPRTNTPSKAAVNGSPSESVTAVEDDTWARPRANNR